MIPLLRYNLIQYIIFENVMKMTCIPKIFRVNTGVFGIETCSFDSTDLTHIVIKCNPPPDRSVRSSRI